MDALMKKMGINKSDIVASVPTRATGKETPDSELLKKVRKLMNNTFLTHTQLINNATYFEPIYNRDEKGRILLDKHGKKSIEGYKTKNLTGQFVVEDNKDGTHTATRFNVYKDTYTIDSNSLDVLEVKNGSN